MIMVSNSFSKLGGASSLWKFSNLQRSLQHRRDVLYYWIHVRDTVIPIQISHVRDSPFIQCVLHIAFVSPLLLYLGKCIRCQTCRWFSGSSQCKYCCHGIRDQEERQGQLSKKPINEERNGPARQGAVRVKVGATGRGVCQESLLVQTGKWACIRSSTNDYMPSKIPTQLESMFPLMGRLQCVFFALSIFQ